VVDAVALGNFLIAICANGDNRILLWDGISRYEEVKMGYQEINIQTNAILHTPRVDVVFI
jgi:hypothetical protein